MDKRKRSITRTLFFYTAISIAVILGSFALFLVINELQRVNKDIEEKKNIYINGKKKSLRSYVNLTIDFINFEKSLFEEINGDSIYKLQSAILEQIAKIRFSNDRYIFVVSYDGTTLMNDVQREMIGKNQWDIIDPNGVKIVQEERKAVENPEGEFIFYSWYKPNAKVPTPKISFVQGIPEWEWMVGTGIYLEDIDKIILREHEAAKKLLTRYILVIVGIFGFLIFLLLIIAKYVANKTRESFTIFSNFFKQAAARSTKIDIHKLYFSEFNDPANAANEMVEKLDKAKNELIKFNQELEQRVKERTNEIIQQKEEILTQNEELEKHRNNLEKIVKERTKDLEFAKEKAEESDRLKSSFLANMSHEIRTPMNAIIGFSNLLIENNIDSGTRTDLTNEITKNGFSLLNLIENILDLAKIETSQIKIVKTEFSLNELLNEIYYSFFEIIKNKKLEFILNSDIQNDLVMYSDPIRVKQILKNLIENAIKYTENGSIEIGHTINKEYITIYVKDTGIGITEKQLSCIFERFSKIEDEKQKLYRGAGLGLSICKHLTKLLDGKILVESEVNKGTTFYLKIPLNKIEKVKITEQKNTTLQSQYNWSDKNILIAEDDQSNFRYFNMILSETNINILHAENGKDAVKKCKENNFDLILMDIKMPEMDGLEATRIIKKSKPDITIIAQTAFAMENDEKASLEAGCSAFIQKPIQKLSLLSLLNKFLS